MHQIHSFLLFFAFHFGGQSFDILSIEENSTSIYSKNLSTSEKVSIFVRKYDDKPLVAVIESRKTRRHRRRRHTKKKLGSDEPSNGAIPRQIECYSCMSLSYQMSWKYLHTTYLSPKMFTDRCKDPQLEKAMPTVGCNSVCVSLMEPDIEAGVLIGFKHIRGCMDRILRNGFNESAIRTHRFNQNNQCRTLSRSSLFNPIKDQEHLVLGEVQLCSCYGDRCNGGSAGSKFHFFTVFFVVLIAGFLRQPWPDI